MVTEATGNGASKHPPGVISVIRGGDARVIFPRRGVLQSDNITSHDFNSSSSTIVIQIGTFVYVRLGVPASVSDFVIRVFIAHSL